MEKPKRKSVQNPSPTRSTPSQFSKLDYNENNFVPRWPTRNQVGANGIDIWLIVHHNLRNFSLPTVQNHGRKITERLLPIKPFFRKPFWL